MPAKKPKKRAVTKKQRSKADQSELNDAELEKVAGGLTTAQSLSMATVTPTLPPPSSLPNGDLGIPVTVSGGGKPPAMGGLLE